MNKPKGMSRKDYHALKSIVRSFAGDRDTLVFTDPDYNDGSMHGGVSQSHDEGYSRVYVQAGPGEKPGTYDVTVYRDSRDCDGKTSSTDDYVVVRRNKRKRYYMGWAGNRGAFGVKSEWAIIERGKGSQRDYTAEAAGY